MTRYLSCDGGGVGALPSGTGLSQAEPEVSALRASIPSAADVRAWLVGMTKQGEDRVWRGAEKAIRFFDATIAPQAERWCWVSDDPESTHPSPLEWADYVAPYLDSPFVQRFDWGVTAPSTWVVFSEDHAGWPVAEEFSSEAQAEARQAELAQAIEARRAATPESDAVEDESAVATPCANTSQGIVPSGDPL
jgi:hypothetical protein